MRPEDVEKRRSRGRRWYHKHKKTVADRRRKRRYEKPEEYLVSSARSSARKRGIPFELTASDITVPAKCPVLGFPIGANRGGGYHPTSATIDRINNDLGYVPGNVCVISARANMLKRDSTINELEAILKYMKKSCGP